MGEFASKGVAGSGLGLGIAGTALGLLNANGNGGGLLCGLFGGGKVELSGYMVDKADIDALLEIAKKHAVE